MTIETPTDKGLAFDLDNESKDIIDICNELLYRIKYAEEMLQACLSLNEIVETSKIEVIKLANDYFTVTYLATRDMLCVECAKIYDTHKDSVSVFKLIEKCKGSPDKLLTKQKKVLIAPYLQKFDSGIKCEKYQIVISNLKIRRDKYYDHYDKDYFFDIKKLVKEFPVSYDDLNDIIRIAKELCVSIYQELSNTEWKSLLHQNVFSPQRSCDDIKKLVDYYSRFDSP